jgi:hypothetical protein
MPTNSLARWFALIAVVSVGACGGAEKTVSTSDESVYPVWVYINPEGVPSSLEVGQAFQLTATVRDKDGNSILNARSWQSSNPAVATIDASGVVRAVAPGTTSIQLTVVALTSSALTITVRPVGPILTYLQVSTLGTGAASTCAMTPADELYCWGASYGNSPARIPGTVPRLTNIVVSYNTGCGLAADGQAWCWGSNENGEFGVATTSITKSPIAPAGGSLRFRQITLGQGGTYLCGIAIDRTGYCWGDNRYGQLGIGSKGGIVPTPTPIVGGPRWATLAAEGDHTCGIVDSGETYCWGQNDWGQLGDGTQTNALTPVAVRAPARFAKVDVGAQHSCALTDDGRAFCWGRGDTGNIGVSNALISYSVPQRVDGAVAFVELSAGTEETCARNLEGAAYCWGLNQYYDMGIGSVWSQPTPAAVSTNIRFSSLHAGSTFRCGIELGTDYAVCWGGNEFGQLGRGTSTYVASGTPQRVPIGVAP